MIFNYKLFIIAIKFIIHIMSLWYAIQVIIISNFPESTLAWVISLISFPYIAVPLYCIFGRRIFKGYININKKFLLNLNKNIKHYIVNKNIKPFQLLIKNLINGHFTIGNYSKLLIDGYQTYYEIIKAINAAQKYILLQYFIIRDDFIGTMISQYLIKKAKSGIKIYLLYDEIGCHNLSKNYILKLKLNGVNISPFYTTKGISNIFQLNFRNHRKIVVIDGKIGFMGGLNIGDEYISLNKKIGFWRDTFIYLKGPCVLHIQLSFVQDWYWATGNIINLRWQSSKQKNNEHIAILPIGPNDKYPSGPLLYMELIHMAKKILWIATPYFVLEHAMLLALGSAAIRGVDVRILLPNQYDHLLVHLCSLNYYSILKKYNIKIYRYNKGFMHHKILLVDNIIANIGSVNLDNRSLKINFEIMCILASASSVKQIKKMFLNDIQYSTLINVKDDISFYSKIIIKVAYLFAALL